VCIPLARNLLFGWFLLNVLWFILHHPVEVLQVKVYFPSGFPKKTLEVFFFLSGFNLNYFILD